MWFRGKSNEALNQPWCFTLVESVLLLAQCFFILLVPSYNDQENDRSPVFQVGRFR